LDTNNQPTYGRERGCFIRTNPSRQEIIAASKPDRLSGKFDIVPFYSLGDSDGDGFEDCAQFASQCLSAGNIHMNEAGVPRLIQ
jgi:hypothetical protein